MPFRKAHPLLRLDCPALTGIDTSSTEDLYSMWSLFSKTSHAMEDGKRLENLSWRLWTRETFCCEPKTQAQSTQATSTPRRATSKAAMATADIPALSSSLSSATSDEMDEPETSSPSSACIYDRARPALKRQDSMTSRSRGFEKHITPIDLEKIVISIQETKDLESIDLPMSTPSLKTTAPQTDSATSKLSQLNLNDSAPRTRPVGTSLPRVANAESAKIDSSASPIDTEGSSLKNSQTVGSEDSSSTEMSSHSVVRGFVPGGAPSSYRSQTHLAAAQPTPILKTSPSYHPGLSKKKGPMFTIGTSSGEEESSLESRYQKGHPLGSVKSSLSESIKKQDQQGSRKVASFKLGPPEARVAEHSPVFDSDDEDEDVSESAIDDDDDSSDWEDSDEASGPSSMNERDMFHRVDSRPNLTSRKSLLTSLMHEPDRAKALQNAASKSTPAMRRSRTSSPNGPSIAASPQPGVQLHVPSQEPERSRPIIMTTSNTSAHLSLSPRTTRRNMLSTELTESLRKNLLWERQHKSSNNLAAMKRRHTSTDVKNLRQHPEPGPVIQQGSGAKTFSNDFFNAGLQEYHTKGW